MMQSPYPRLKAETRQFPGSALKTFSNPQKQLSQINLPNCVRSILKTERWDKLGNVGKFITPINTATSTWLKICRDNMDALGYPRTHS
jgi:hypothetical protein